jgi:phosphoribosylformylglycinamidine synthase
MQFKAQVRIRLKKGVLDPQGATVQGALSALGYGNISEVRMGKLIEFLIDAPAWEQAEVQIEEMSRRLLANPVMEEYSFEVNEDDASPLATAPPPPEGRRG